MQTNREDVGKRLFEIKIPVPADETIAKMYAKPFRRYYKNLERLRKKFSSDLENSDFEHHIYFS